jgi:outer membrane lipoprotein carrier protein
MRRLLLASVIAPLLAFAPAPAFAQQGVEAVVDKAVAAYGRVKTVRARFEQRLTNPLTGSTITQQGTLQQRLPNELAVTFSNPKGDRIVADGKALWVYTPSSAPNQVIKLPVGAGSAGGLDLAAQFFDKPKSRYTMSEAGRATVGGRATRAVNLVPRQPMQFTRAIVWVDTADGTLRQFEVTEPSGLVRRVTLSDIRINAAVDKGAFTFAVPKGVKVYGQEAFGGSR